MYITQPTELFVKHDLAYFVILDYSRHIHPNSLQQDFITLLNPNCAKRRLTKTNR